MAIPDVKVMEQQRGQLKGCHAVGQSWPRADGPEKVTGRARFVADLSMPHMLYARVVRSPVPHGELRGVDIREALAVEGVEAVLTAKDIPGRNIIPVVFRDQPCLAQDRVAYVGEPVALVAGTTPEAAALGARAVKLNIALRPALTDPERARDPASPRIYGQDNVFSSYRVRNGDAQAALAGAAVVVEEVYRTPYQEHAYIEPQGMLAVAEPDGAMTVTGSCQCPYYIQEALCEVLDLGRHKVRVIQATTGGAFGGKEDVPSLVACQAALLARATGRPVKLIYDRAEDIRTMSKRHPGVIRCRTGASAQGELVGAEVEYLLDGGAYATLSPVVLWRGTVHAVGPYRCPNVSVDSYAVATNRVPCGAFRGFGSPQVLFACESQMDQLAHRLGMDPAEFRRRNLLRQGDATPAGQVLTHEVGGRAALDKALEASGWTKRRAELAGQTGVMRRGLGLSVIFYGVGLGAGGEHMARTGAQVQMAADGTATFAVGTTEMGQGMQTVLGQIVAEELGLEASMVRMMPTDTSRVPDSGPTVASRATTMSGNALRDACAPIAKVLREEAARMLEANPQDVILARGQAQAGDAAVPLRQVVAHCVQRRDHLASHGWNKVPHMEWDRATGLGEAYVTYAWAAKVAEVEVDTETGEVNLIRLYAAHDVGKAVNPMLVEGQIEGGSLQGAGYGLTEEILSRNGYITTADLSTYIIPTSLDAPEIIPLIVECPFPGGPYGAKGFGEQPLMGVAPAITNAIFHATGARVTEIPATPERVLKAMENDP